MERTYENWVIEKTKYLNEIFLYDKERTDYIFNWISQIDSSSEFDLLKNFHPSFTKLDDSEESEAIVFGYIHTIRSSNWTTFNKLSQSEEFDWWNFDMLFTFYTPYLIKRYEKEYYSTSEH